MYLGLVRCDLAGLHHARNQRVILGELPQRTCSKEVGPGIAHMSQVHAGVLYQDGSQCRAHPRHLPVRLRALEDRTVRLSDPLRQCLLPVRRHLLQDLEGELRCDLPAAMTAYPVGDGEKRGIGKERVLVALPNLADIGRRAGLDPHRRSSSTVVPTRILSPAWTIAGAASFCSLTKVPLVEPRSSTYHAPFFPNRRACC